MLAACTCKSRPSYRTNNARERNLASADRVRERLWQVMCEHVLKQPERGCVKQQLVLLDKQRDELFNEVLLRSLSLM